MVRLAIHKEFLTINKLIARWERPKDDIRYVVEHDDMPVYVRPLAIEAALAPLFSLPALEKLKRCPFSPVDIYRLFYARNERVLIRHQLKGMAKYQIKIGFDDMIVLTADIELYEHNNRAENKNDFRVIKRVREKYGRK